MLNLLGTKQTGFPILPEPEHPVSDEDMWRAYNRQLYNKTGGKEGFWARGRDPVKVPDWYKKRLEKHRTVGNPQRPFQP